MVAGSTHVLILLVYGHKTVSRDAYGSPFPIMVMACYTMIASCYVEVEYFTLRFSLGETVDM